MSSARIGAEVLNEEQLQSEWLTEFLKSGAVTLALTKDQAANQLQIGRTKLDSYIDAGLIRVCYYEPNGHPRILLSEVFRFLSERQRESNHADATSRATHGAGETAMPRLRTRGAQRKDAKDDLAKFDALTKKRR